jgi:WD40 repeat protein/tRNA A-37 threonylcarbamoyl transferase component Bud32
MKPPEDKEVVLFREALQRAKGPEREAFLDQACAGEKALRGKLEALLQAHESPDPPLEPQPAPPGNSTVVLPVEEGPGSLIGRYKILEQIGEGGFGVVYVAEQREPVKRRVALKVIKLGMDTRQVVARFEAERQALALMDHPNIAKVLDAGATDTGRPFFVMELVKGIPITKYCDQEKVATRERLDLFIKVCHAIQHAHQKGIIHRDIKPSNILVTLHDGVPVPKVIDFGIAKATQQELTEKTVYTQLQQFIGTPAYMSPEQAEMSGLDIDTRSDIYSLGVLLYELLTGSTPFDTKELVRSGLDEMRKIIRERQPVRPSTRLRQTALTVSPSPLSTLHSALSSDLDWIVMKCLEKDRTRRYETANGVALDIERHLKHEPVVARPPSVGYRLQKSFRRNKLVFSAAGVVGLALVLGVVVSSWQAIRAMEARRKEAAARVRADEAARVADSQRERAEKGEQQAKASELAARRNLYAADMVLAQQAFAEGNLGYAMKLLSKYDPNEAGSPAVKTGRARMPVSDLRDWEWRYLWQQSRSDELYTLGLHHGGGGVVEVVFAPDGRRLASRSQSGQAILWDVERKRSIAGWSDLTNGVSAIGFSKDGRTLAVANGSGKAVRFFETTTGREMAGPLWFTAPVWQLAFSPDGKTLAVSTGQELVTVDAAKRAERFRKQVPWGSAWRMTFSPDGSTLAMLTGEGDVILWDVASQSQIAKLPGLRPFLAYSLAFSPDGNLLACACMLSQRAIIWDVKTKQVIKTLETTTHWIGGIAFSPGGETAAIVTDDQVITLFDRKSWQKIGRLKGHLDEVWCVAFSPDGRLLVTGGKDNTIRAWSAAPRAAAEDLLPLPPETDGVRLSADGKTLVTLTTNDSFSLWDTAAMRRTVTKPLPWTNFWHSDYAVSPVAISSGGKLLMIPRTDGAISAWETDTLREAARLEGFRRPAQRVTLSGDGRTLAAASGNAVKLWDLETGKPVASWSNLVSWVRSLFHSPEHKLLIVGYGNGQAEVCDLGRHTHWRARLGHELGIAAAAVSPNGRTLATGSIDARVKLWDIAHDKPIDTLSGQRNAYQSIVISPDGRRIAAGGDDGTIRIWDSETHQGVAVLRAHKRFVPCMAFLPDGTTLVSASLDALRVWRAPALDKIELAQKLYALERAERARDEGAITDWLVLAPVSFLPGQTGPEALEAEQVAGERQLRPKGGRTVGVGGRELRWREVHLNDSILDFNEVLGQQTEESVAYAGCYIESEIEQQGLRLCVGSDDEAKVYLNGQEKYKCCDRRPLIAGQDKVEDVALRAGLNVLVFKVINEDLNWGGSIRLTDREGNPVKGIKVTLTP